METQITPAELAADQAAEAAMQALRDFRGAHWGYFWNAGHVDPLTGRPTTTPRPELDREAHRLHMLAAQANRHAANVERAARSTAP